MYQPKTFTKHAVDIPWVHLLLHLSVSIFYLHTVKDSEQLGGACGWYRVESSEDPHTLHIHCTILSLPYRRHRTTCHHSTGLSVTSPHLPFYCDTMQCTVVMLSPVPSQGVRLWAGQRQRPSQVAFCDRTTPCT